MKLAARDLPGYFAKPDPGKAGLLIYGADAMRVALRRQETLKALVGEKGEEEMRLTRMSGADLRRDPAMLADAVKAQGFFPGTRAVFLEEASDAVAEIVSDALDGWSEGDANIVVTAGTLKAASKLRKLFEGHKGAYAAAIYDNPPSAEEVNRILSEAGLGSLDADAREGVGALARELDPGDFRQTIEKLALYKLGEEGQVTADDVAACAPASTEAALDDVLNAVAEARREEVGPILKRLRAQGAEPVGLCMAATRHFWTLYKAAADPKGPEAGIANVRPPVFGQRRSRMSRQAQNWGGDRLGKAMSMLAELDLTLRSPGQTAPAMPLVERALIRLAMLGARRR